MDEENIESLGAAIRARTSDQVERVRALHDWVARNIAYDVTGKDDPAARDVDPAEVFARREGVCAGYSRLLAVLGRAADADIRLVDGTTPAGPHEWNEVMVDGVLEPIDVTWDAGYLDASGHFRRQYSTKYFLTDHAVFRRDHIAESYPPVPDMRERSPAYAASLCTAAGSCSTTQDAPSAFRSACEAGVAGACYEVEWISTASH